MARVLVALDAFKGSLDQVRACEVVRNGLHQAWDDLDVDLCPLADGGEGTGAVLLAEGAQVHHMESVDAYGRPHRARWYKWGRIALVEASEGSPYVPEGDRPLHAWASTSAGTGVLIKNALEDPEIESIWVALGGTGSVDGGMGLLAALGAEFFDGAGRPLEALATQWSAVAEVRLPKMGGRPITALCDVMVPLLGPHGALETFGPQKGLSLEEARVGNVALGQFADRVAGWARDLPGAGAAGGMGFALAALGAELTSGARFLAEHVGLRERMEQADWVITGEGRLDQQSLMGKVVAVVLELGLETRTPVIALAGQLPSDLDPFFRRGLAFAEPLGPRPMTLAEALSLGEDCLQAAGVRLGWLLRWMRTKGDAGNV